MVQINKQKIAVLIFLQFGLLVSLSLQLHGMLMKYSLLQAKRNSMVSAYLATKKDKWQRKRKHIQSRNLRRRTKSAWVFLGKTDEWWQKMIRRDVLERIWKNLFE